MKRSRLVAFGATLILVAGTVAGGISLLNVSAHAAASGMAPGQIPLDTLTHSPLGHEENLPAQKHVNGHIAHGIPNIDSVPTFSGKYHADGFDPNGTPNKQWVYNTIGSLPQHGGTTTIRVPIIPISLDLLAPDGSLLIHDRRHARCGADNELAALPDCYVFEQQHPYPVQRRRPAG